MSMVDISDVRALVRWLKPSIIRTKHTTYGSESESTSGIYVLVQNMGELGKVHKEGHLAAKLSQIAIQITIDCDDPDPDV